MLTNRIFELLMASAVCLCLASPALAVPYLFELQSGVENGFGFSGLHDADDDTPMTGASLGDLSGTLILDYNGVDTYSFVASTVVLTSDTYAFAITGGELRSDGAGFLDFELIGMGGFAQVSSIIFAGGGPVCCGVDGPNWVNPGALRLWGASSRIATTGGGAGTLSDTRFNGVPKRIGMDLGATGSPAVPEPSSALVFGAGALVLQGAIRRRRSGSKPTK